MCIREWGAILLSAALVKMLYKIGKSNFFATALTVTEQYSKTILNEGNVASKP